MHLLQAVHGAGCPRPSEAAHDGEGADHEDVTDARVPLSRVGRDAEHEEVPDEGCGSFDTHVQSEMHEVPWEP